MAEIWDSNRKNSVFHNMLPHRSLSVISKAVVKGAKYTAKNKVARRIKSRIRDRMNRLVGSVAAQYTSRRTGDSYLR